MSKKIALVLAAMLVAAGAGVWVYANSSGKEAGFINVIFKKKQPRPSTVALGEFVTNLNDSCGSCFIKVSINVEVADAKTAQDIQHEMAAARDMVLKVLRSKTSADVAGEQGMKALARDIADRLSLLVAEGSIINVYFTDFAVQ